jgi:protein-disulfide isomerase/uncharacterized membrane protein
MQKEKKIKAAELWQTSYDWLILCGNKIHKTSWKEDITTHPDYPALTSLADLLENGGMAYKALQVDASHIQELRYPLLAHIKKPGQEFMHVIPDIDAWDEQIDITQHWSGIVFFTEGKGLWKSEQNERDQRESIKKRGRAIAFVLLGMACFVISILLLPDLPINIFGFFSLSGLTISLFALGTELGFQSQIVKQVCGTVSKNGCEDVLTSKYAKGIGGVTPSDAAILYFSTQYIAYLAGSYYLVLLPGLMILSLGGIAIAAWSVVTQALIIKKWCALCLAIVTVLVAQALIALRLPASPIPFSSIFAFALILAIFSMALFSIKEVLKQNVRNKVKLAELKKWKLDAGLFMAQWKQGQEVDSSIWQDDLILGHPDAPVQITVACNPYCGPCAKAHKKLETLLDQHINKVKVQIRFTFSLDNQMDRRISAAKAILQKAHTLKDNTQLRDMLTDWFNWMDDNRWSEKWKPDPAVEVDQNLIQHNFWIKENHITSTPTFFINGKKMPGRYSLDDLMPLIPQLEGQMLD